MPNIRVKRLHEKAQLPMKAYESDAGYDVYTLEGAVLKAGESGIEIRTGIAVAPPPGYWLMLCGRSSSRHAGIDVATAIIDGGYRGEIVLGVGNLLRNRPIIIEEGQRIAQLIPLPIADFLIYEAGDLPASERGQRGFGSSGK